MLAHAPWGALAPLLAGAFASAPGTATTPYRFFGSAAADDDGGLIGGGEVAPADPRGGLRIERGVALDDLRRLGDEGLRLAPEGRLDHLLHVVDKDEFHGLADL